jgi:hypothetical protein
VNADTSIGFRLFTANDPESAGFARSAPEIEIINFLAALAVIAISFGVAPVSRR